MNVVEGNRPANGLLSTYASISSIPYSAIQPVDLNGAGAKSVDVRVLDASVESGVIISDFLDDVARLRMRQIVDDEMKRVHDLQRQYLQRVRRRDHLDALTRYEIAIEGIRPFTHSHIRSA